MFCYVVYLIFVREGLLKYKTSRNTKRKSRQVIFLPQTLEFLKSQNVMYDLVFTNQLLYFFLIYVWKGHSNYS